MMLWFPKTPSSHRHPHYNIHMRKGELYISHISQNLNNMRLQQRIITASLPALLLLLTTSPKATHASAVAPRQSSDWHFRLCALTNCKSPTTGPVQSCFDTQGDLTFTGADSCTGTTVRDGESSYFSDWQSFKKISLSTTFVQRNCSIKLYTTPDVSDFYCTSEWFVGEIDVGDKGKCHAPKLPGSSQGRGITSYSIECTS